MRSIRDWFNEHKHELASKVALECGALDFEDSRMLGGLFQTVLSFEANPLAKVPTDLPSNVIVELQALSTFTGTISFFRDENPRGNSGASSLLPAKPFFLTDYIKKETELQVPCISLDDALHKHKVNHADFFWLDMEGYELEFLRGTSLNKVQYIYTEVNFQEFRTGGCLYEDLKTYLESQGFTEKERFVKDDTWAGDVLFARSDTSLLL